MMAVCGSSPQVMKLPPSNVMRMFGASTSFRVRASESPELHIFPAFSMLKIMPASCASAAAWRSPSM